MLNWSLSRVVVPLHACADVAAERIADVRRDLNRLSSGVYRLCRRSGRAFHVMSALPQDVRSRLRFRLPDGSLDSVAEVDLKSSYWTVLCSQLRDGPTRERLIADLQSGEFYERLAAAAAPEYQYECRGELKQSVNKHCLFAWWRAGEESFTCHPLWHALSREYPELAALIRSMRQRHYGPTVLARRLCEIESRLMIDRLLVMLGDAGVPVVPYHDGLMVPSSLAEKARRVCVAVGEQFFGFRPVFEVTAGAADREQ